MCKSPEISMFQNLQESRGTLCTQKDPAGGNKVHINYSKLGPLEYTQHSSSWKQAEFISLHVAINTTVAMPNIAAARR